MVANDAESVASERWSEVKMLQQEIKWANEMLDRYGAPRKHYNPYEGEEFDLNLAGRISVWLDPKNQGGWTVNNPEVQRLIDSQVTGRTGAEFVRWQKCPVCDGTGLVSRPPGVAADQPTFVSTSCGPWPCGPCTGSGLLRANGPTILELENGY